MKILVCDFETTVFDGQTSTEVWASAIVELHTEDVIIFHSIEETFDYLVKLKESCVCYYHNLKFDGAFWLAYLLRKTDYLQAYEQDENGTIRWIKNVKDMRTKTFKYSISDMGQWYSITIKTPSNNTIEIRDSLKLLPFSVKKIGKSFQTKHKKLDMEYEGYRYAGCEITPEEKKYIRNDVLVVKEALEIMFDKGHKKLTIGACCMEEFKKTFHKFDYENFFPDMTEYAVKEFNCNADDFIRKSYRGGWCYLVEEKSSKRYNKGITADVNSLYPSMMHSESGNIYPVGKPKFWLGNEIPKQALGKNKYFFVRIKTRFKLKEGKLPFIQIKGSILYKGTESLKTTDFYNKRTGKYTRYYTDSFGLIHDTFVIMTMTMTDYYLFLEHYDVFDFEIQGGCWFYAESGLFDTYIDKYRKIKQESKGAMRELAKLFLNNLYGKLASNTDSSFKFAYIDKDQSINFKRVDESDKKAGYIPIGSAITSYAREFTIRAAQANYHGEDRGFIYADTDSIHCDLEADEIVGIKVHPSNFCCWKLEATWDTGWFVRQKTYIEHVIEENLEPCEPFYNIKCAGMSQRCKDLFLSSLGESVETIEKDKEKGKLTEDEIDYLKENKTVEDFNIGLELPSKLLPKRIEGGVLLVPTTYKMR